MNYITVVAHGSPGSFVRCVQENPQIAIDYRKALEEMGGTLLIYDGHVTNPNNREGWTEAEGYERYTATQALLKRDPNPRMLRGTFLERVAADPMIAVHLARRVSEISKDLDALAVLADAGENVTHRARGFARQCREEIEKQGVPPDVLDPAPTGEIPVKAP